MAKVKDEVKIPFDDGDIYILYYSDDEEGYGIEILGEEGKGGDLVTMEDWSFGHGKKALKTSERWMSYVTHHIHKQPENSEDPIPDFIRSVSCNYNPENPESNLRDLKTIKELVKNDKL